MNYIGQDVTEPLDKTQPLDHTQPLTEINSEEPVDSASVSAWYLGTMFAAGGLFGWFTRRQKDSWCRDKHNIVIERIKEKTLNAQKNRTLPYQNFEDQYIPISGFKGAHHLARDET
jgi:hypothetical protein